MAITIICECGCGRTKSYTKSVFERGRGKYFSRECARKVRSDWVAKRKQQEEVDHRLQGILGQRWGRGLSL